MNYLIRKTFTIDDDFWEVGLRRDNDEWYVDSSNFGNIPLNALTGPIGDICRKLTLEYKQVKL